MAPPYFANPAKVLGRLKASLDYLRVIGRKVVKFPFKPKDFRVPAEKFGSAQ